MDVIRQSDAQGLAGLDLPRRGQHLQRHRAADQPAQALRAAEAGRDAEI